LFAKQGYDFVGIDQRGFGFSEGERGMIECESKTIDDLIQHIDQVNEKYGGNHVKKYAIGFSFGGLLTTKITAIRPELFTSVALLAPFFSFLQKEKFEKHYATVETLSKTNPTHKLMILPMKPLPPSWTLHFVVDPVCETRDISARNLYELSQGPLRLTDSMIASIKSPILMITGEREQVVNNGEAK
jgi:alpha-beta hydrolase superfamily lysophospholipase